MGQRLRSLFLPVWALLSVPVSLCLSTFLSLVPFNRLWAPRRAGFFPSLVSVLAPLRPLHRAGALERPLSRVLCRAILSAVVSLTYMGLGKCGETQASSLLWQLLQWWQNHWLQEITVFVFASVLCCRKSRWILDSAVQFLARNNAEGSGRKSKINFMLKSKYTISHMKVILNMETKSLWHFPLGNGKGWFPRIDLGISTFKKLKRINDSLKL